MSWLDRLLGREQDRERLSDDERALERYRYLLRTAPPEALEEVHAEAFGQLTPEQRQQVLRELAAQVPEHERAGVTDDPRSLARLATRAEVRQPGTLERTFGNMRTGAGGPGYAGSVGPSFGSMFASSLLGSIAGYVIGSAIAEQFFANNDAFAGTEAGAWGGDSGTDVGGGDIDAGGDWGGDIDVSDV
jgi:hypothetical protein